MDNSNTDDRGDGKVHMLKQVPQTQTALRRTLSRLFEAILLCGFVLIVLISLIRVIPGFEVFIFPASAQIESLKNQKDALKQELEFLQKTFGQFKSRLENFEKTVNQVEKNTKKISSVEVDVSDLKRKIIQVKIANGSEMSEKIQKIWNVILDKKAKGQAFADDLGSMIPYVGTFKEMVDSIHGLSSLAEDPVLTMEALKTELNEIKAELIEQKKSEIEPTTWIGKFFRSVKDLVIVRKAENDKPITSVGVIKDLDQSLATVDIALDLIKNDALKDAIEAIRKTPIPNDRITHWLAQSELRINLDKAFKKMQKLMELMKS